VIAAAVWAVAWLRGRAAVATYAALVEAAVDVHKTELARRAGLLGPEEDFSSAVGHRVTGTFRKGS
jgi:hypothetical protein